MNDEFNQAAQHAQETLGSLLAGAPLMQQEADVSIDVVRIIQSMVLLFVAADAIVRYIFRIRGPGLQKLDAPAAGWGGP